MEEPKSSALAITAVSEPMPSIQKEEEKHRTQTFDPEFGVYRKKCVDAPDGVINTAGALVAMSDLSAKKGDGDGSCNGGGGKLNLTDKERRRVIRNVLAVSAAYMMHFTAFVGATNLQSSINAAKGLGTVSLAAVYAALLISTIFLPVVTIQWLGCKWAMLTSFLMYVPYMCSQFAASYATVMPGALLVGAGGGPFWCTQCIYVCVLADVYARATGQSTEVIVVRFFGIFYTVYEFGQIFGNLVSSLVLSGKRPPPPPHMGPPPPPGFGPPPPPPPGFGPPPPPPPPGFGPPPPPPPGFGPPPPPAFGPPPPPPHGIGPPPPPPPRHPPPHVLWESCGGNYFPADALAKNPNLERPPDDQIFVIAGIYLAIMLFSCLIVVFGLDQLTRFSRLSSQTEPQLSGMKLLKKAWKLLKNKYQLLLLPLTVWLGLEKAVIAADYTSSYVTCAWGVENIGYVMMCYGAFNSLSALTTGWLVKLTGRPPVILGAAIVHITLCVGLLFWHPLPHQIGIYFLCAGIWGACDGVWNVQINALCGILFPGQEKVAYSTFRLWESLGYILAYGYSAYLRTDVKLYIVLGLLIVGIIGYIIIEISKARDDKKALSQRSQTVS